MSSRIFRLLVTSVGAAFFAFFLGVVVPPLIAQPDVVGAFAAGFVNPYASGYAMDTICCWLILALWVVHEARTAGVKHGWLAIALGVVPGVAVGFAFYLLLRMRQGVR